MINLHKKFKRLLWRIKTPSDLVSEFAYVMEQDPSFEDWGLNTSMAKFRASLVEEECRELLEATDSVNAVKELADIIYVVYGYAHEYGWDLDEALVRVHESNMSKLYFGRPLKDDTGKVLKGPDYLPPVGLEDLV